MTRGSFKIHDLSVSTHFIDDTSLSQISSSPVLHLFIDITLNSKHNSKDALRNPRVSPINKGLELIM